MNARQTRRFNETELESDGWGDGLGWELRSGPESEANADVSPDEESEAELEANWGGGGTWKQSTRLIKSQMVTSDPNLN
jgi:hypothetical protein